MSIASQYITGHNFLLHHQKKMINGEARKKFTNSKCRLFNREEKTTEHMLFKCDALAVTNRALAVTRANTLGVYFLNFVKDRLNLEEVITFLKTADLAYQQISEGHLTNLNPPTI